MRGHGAYCPKNRQETETGTPASAGVPGSPAELLPDFSVVGDPLEQRGIITWRPIADDRTQIHLVIQRVRSLPGTRPVQDLHRIFVERAQAYGAGRPAAGRGTAGLRAAG
jgi:hypothetical protein